MGSKGIADEDADLAVGAVAVAQEAFDGKVGVRQVYRMNERGDWPFFKLQGKIAARPSAVRAEMARREARAVLPSK